MSDKRNKPHARPIKVTIGGEIVPPGEYEISFSEDYAKRVKILALKCLPVLEVIALHGDSDRARLAAIQEINNRALGAANQSISVSGRIEHASHYDLLTALHRRLAEQEAQPAITCEPLDPEDDGSA